MFHEVLGINDSVVNRRMRFSASARGMGWALAALLLAGAPSLRAGDTPKFGAEIHLNLPTDPLKTDTHSKVGGGAAFQVTFDLGAGHALRPRVTANLFRVADAKGPGSDRRTSTDLLNAGLGADYLYHFGGRADRGAYALAGLSYEYWALVFDTNDTSGDGTTTYSAKTTHRKSGLGGALGLGYHMNAWFGLESRYSYSKYEGVKGADLGRDASDAPPAVRSAGAIQLAATFRW